MTIIDVLKRILGKTALAQGAWTQTQREALVDLLVLGMYADGNLSLAETDLLENEIQGLTAETGIAWDTYLAKAFHAIRQTQGDRKARNALLCDIRERLESQDKRQHAAAELQALLAIDGYDHGYTERVFWEDVKAFLKLRPLSRDAI